MKKPTRKKPLKIKVKPSTYNPTKAERDEEICLDTTPEHLVKMMQHVEIRHEK